MIRVDPSFFFVCVWGGGWLLHDVALHELAAPSAGQLKAFK